MNEQIKELAKQAGFDVEQTAYGEKVFVDGRGVIEELERFAELVRQDERDWDKQAILIRRIRELEAQQTLDKKADNARELGLDYEPEEFVRWSKEKEFFDAAHASQQADKQEPVANRSNCGHKEYKPFCQMCMATKQKPVAWVCEGFGKEKHNLDYVQDDIDALEIGTALYTAPPQAEKQEPVAYIDHVSGKPKFIDGYVVQTDYDIPLYTAPPMTPEHLPQYFTTNGIKPMWGGGGGGSQPVNGYATSQVHGYTYPPLKEWVELNLDDIPDFFVGDISFCQGAKWAQAKLKEKNT